MSLFKKLVVKHINKETEDSVSIVFDIPTELKSEFNYKSGQYITVRKIIEGEEVRRSYSLCSSPSENDFRIGVKKVENGKMSTFLNESLNVGDEIEIMKPSGNFCVNDYKANILGFAAGSGITPVISIIKTVLISGGKFTLFYGNKAIEETIFKSQLDKLKEEYNNQFDLHYTYDNGLSENKLENGRIDKEKVSEFMKENINLLRANEFFMCGPEQMIIDVSDALKEMGVNENKIHFELFTAPTQKAEEKKIDSNFSGESQVTVILDGDEFKFNLKSDGNFILDAAMDKGADVPFSCKGAVCCTCKAQVIEGKAIMEMNYSLSDEEVEDGFILTCQSHPASEVLVVDYDVS